MHRVLSLSLALSALCIAQPSGIAIKGQPYPTNTIICATVNPAMSYSVDVTTDGATIPDVDGTLFTGSDTDTTRGDTRTLGTTRCMRIGHPAYDKASDGKWVSRATEVDKHHTLTWGGTVFEWDTPTLSKDNSYSRPWQVQNGEIINATYDYVNAKFYIDSQTGVRVTPFDQPRQETKDFASCQANNSPCSQSFDGIASSTNWTNPNNSLSNADSNAVAVYTGTTQDWLTFYTKLYIPQGFGGQNLGENPDIDFIGVDVNGNCTGCSSRISDVQLSFDGGLNWASSQVTLPDTTSSTVSTYGLSGASPTPGIGWTAARLPRLEDYELGSGYIYNSGASTTLSFRDSSDCAKLRVGSRVYFKSASYDVSSLSCGTSPATMSYTLDSNHAAVDLSDGGVDGTGYPWRFNVGWTYNPNVMVRIRKNSTASGTVNIQFVTLQVGTSDTARGSSGGFGEHCSHLDNANGRRWCAFGDRIYSLNPNDSTDVRFIGSSYATNCSGNFAQVMGGQGLTWSLTTPNRIYATGTHNTAPYTRSILMWDITADDSVAGSSFNVFSPTSISSTCTDLMPDGGHDLATVLHTYDSHYNSSVYGCELSSVIKGRPNDRGFIRCFSGIQDTFAYIGVFDFGNSQPLGSGGTGAVIAGNYTFKMACHIADGTVYNDFCMAHGLHTTFTLDDLPGVVAFQAAEGSKNQTQGGYALAVKLLNYWDGAAWQPGLPNQAPGTLTDIEITSGPWNATNAGGAQTAGYQTGDPLSNCGPGDCKYASDDTGDYWHGPLRVGMNLCTDYYVPECVQVVSITDATHITVRRAYGIEQDSSYYAVGRLVGGSRIPWASGDYMYVQSADPSNAGVAWNYETSPDGTDAAAFLGCHCPGGGHSIFKKNWMAGSPDQATLYIPAGIDMIMGTTQWLASNNPTYSRIVTRRYWFAGVSANDQGECSEGHLSVSFPWVTSGLQMNVDVHPIVGGTGNTLSCWNSRVDSNPPVHVMGPIWKFSGLNIHPKIFPILGLAGDKTLSNISGPGAMLTTSAADYYKMCYTWVAGQCWTGSSVGDVYASLPHTNPSLMHCDDNTAYRDDVCIGDQPSELSKVNIYSGPTLTNYTDSDNADRLGAAPLVSLWRIGKPSANTDNAKLPTDNTAVYTCWFPRTGLCGIKIPSPWDHTVAKNTWDTHSVLVTNPPTGTSGVILEYGFGFCPDYATNQVDCGGQYPDYELYCTKNAADKCLVTNAIINAANPFTVASALTSPATNSVPCSSGCTVQVPRAPGSTLTVAARFIASDGSTISTTTPDPEATTIDGGGPSSKERALGFDGSITRRGSISAHE